MTWRSASRTEVARYYREEFPTYTDDLPGHITPQGPKQFALSFRTPYPVVGDGIPDREFIRRDTRLQNAAGSRPTFDSVADLVEFIRHPAETDPLQGSDYALADPAVLERPAPVPAAVYYALDHWTRSWPVLVDIDAKDIAAQRTDDDPTSDAPAGYPYTFDDVDRAIEYAFEVRDIFRRRLDASETLVVYSGQGAHVYLLDDDRAHSYDERSRAALVDLLEDAFEIPIDAPVTTDRQRVARLPYSLHGEVSRVVTPIESPDFDPQTQAHPEFLRTEANAGADS